MTALFFLAYPFIIYLLLVNDLPWLGSTFVLGILVWKIHERQDWLYWLAAIVVVCSLVVWLFGPGVISKLPPIFIHSGLLLLFLRSLKSVPLIERFARFDFTELPPEIVVYTRQLTILWTGFFALNIIICIWMAVWGDDELWAFYNGVVVYVLIVFLMLAEYIWRHLRFPELEIPGMRQTVENIVKNGHKIWGGNKRDDAA
ncbi:MAG: hypothetical protein KZQ89_18320 [Candidatus Thiodiazotropha sp. (ex Lucinoma kastoroae)]|nr:hypothetical protein [Candidatus Thiodiazotropha sp. (ex Rostrolucina anterorostrata)]MCU7849902.1 hypothetical protein [Candidatus Thiodiazotropha sp. (ex Lucinoma kastoroae)]MCU7858742.1 hypothetical protein [Candidatus Thiodiazotropha sp. (ex Lucinoma kastoroae)]